MSRNYTPITDAMAQYVREVTLREPEALRRLREATEHYPRASMQIAPEQGQFLHVLTKLIGARNVLEIGVFMGYSSSWIALALPAGGKIVACDVSEEYTAIARNTWREAGVEDKIALRVAPALETLDGLIAAGQSGTFDLAFIDADKSNYSNYYERALQLVRKGGLIAADNTLWDDNTTYFGEGVDANASPDKVAGDVMHELLHSLGFTDDAIQAAFFGHTTYDTGNISDRLATDCFGSNGKGR